MTRTAPCPRHRYKWHMGAVAVAIACCLILTSMQQGQQGWQCNEDNATMCPHPHPCSHPQHNEDEVMLSSPTLSILPHAMVTCPCLCLTNIIPPHMPTPSIPPHAAMTTMVSCPCLMPSPSPHPHWQPVHLQTWTWTLMVCSHLHLYMNCCDFTCTHPCSDPYLQLQVWTCGRHEYGYCYDCFFPFIVLFLHLPFLLPSSIPYYLLWPLSPLIGSLTPIT